MTKTLMLAAALTGTTLIPTTALAQNGKCTSIRQVCALQVGGTCNPATGQWRVGERLMVQWHSCISGGTPTRARR